MAQSFENKDYDFNEQTAFAKTPTEYTQTNIPTVGNLLEGFASNISIQTANDRQEITIQDCKKLWKVRIDVGTTLPLMSVKVPVGRGAGESYGNVERCFSEALRCPENEGEGNIPKLLSDSLVSYTSTAHGGNELLGNVVNDEDILNNFVTVENVGEDSFIKLKVNKLFIIIGICKYSSKILDSVLNLNSICFEVPIKQSPLKIFISTKTLDNVTRFCSMEPMNLQQTAMHKEVVLSDYIAESFIESNISTEMKIITDNEKCLMHNPASTELSLSDVSVDTSEVQAVTEKSEKQMVVIDTSRTTEIRKDDKIKKISEANMYKKLVYTEIHAMISKVKRAAESLPVEMSIQVSESNRYQEKLFKIKRTLAMFDINSLVAMFDTNLSIFSNATKATKRPDASSCKDITISNTSLTKWSEAELTDDTDENKVSQLENKVEYLANDLFFVCATENELCVNSLENHLSVTRHDSETTCNKFGTAISSQANQPIKSPISARKNNTTVFNELTVADKEQANVCVESPVDESTITGYKEDDLNSQFFNVDDLLSYDYFESQMDPLTVIRNDNKNECIPESLEDQSTVEKHSDDISFNETTTDKVIVTEHSNKNDMDKILPMYTSIQRMCIDSPENLLAIAKVIVVSPLQAVTTDNTVSLGTTQLQRLYEVQETKVDEKIKNTLEANENVKKKTDTDLSREEIRKIHKKGYSDCAFQVLRLKVATVHQATADGKHTKASENTSSKSTGSILGNVLCDKTKHQTNKNSLSPSVNVAYYKMKAKEFCNATDGKEPKNFDSVTSLSPSAKVANENLYLDVEATLYHEEFVFAEDDKEPDIFVDSKSLSPLVEVINQDLRLEEEMHFRHKELVYPENDGVKSLSPYAKKTYPVSCSDGEIILQHAEPVSTHHPKRPKQNFPFTISESKFFTNNTFKHRVVSCEQLGRNHPRVYNVLPKSFSVDQIKAINQINVAFKRCLVDELYTLKTELDMNKLNGAIVAELSHSIMPSRSKSYQSECFPDVIQCSNTITIERDKDVLAGNQLIWIKKYDLPSGGSSDADDELIQHSKNKKSKKRFKKLCKRAKHLFICGK